MKKLIIILLIPFNLQAQQEGHFEAGAFIGFVANLETYEILKDTQLKPWQSKLIALGSGIVLGTLAGHAKEEYDEIYNRKDFNYTFLGAVCGSFAVRLALWNSIPKSHVPMEELWNLDNEFLNND